MVATAERCEVCGGGRECRFEKACSCWYGISCERTGKSMREVQQAKRAEIVRANVAAAMVRLAR